MEYISKYLLYIESRHQYSTPKHNLLHYLRKSKIRNKVQEFSNEDIGQPYSKTSIHTHSTLFTNYQALLSENIYKIE